MTSVELAEKACSVCGETKPLSEFHRQSSTPDGHRYNCKACTREATLNSIARRRAEMGEEAWLAHQREITRRHRERTGNETGKAYDAARNKAITTLIERHRDEFEHLVLLARRGELD